MRKYPYIGVWLIGLLSLLLFFAVGCAGSLTVPDTACEVRELCVACDGEHPAAIDFLTDAAQSICRERGLTVDFAEHPNFGTPGEQTVQLTVGGEPVEAVCRVVEDTTPPVFSGVRDRSALVGSGVALRDGVSVEDDCFGRIEWTVDTSALNIDCAGFYAVYYRAVDASGNEAERMAYITVYAEEITEAQLYAACDDYLATLLPAEANREEICRAVYAGIQQSVSYYPVSDKTSMVRAAYLALFRDGRGDCYSFFAAAAALLSRAGIEYLAVERTHAEGESTHYWLMVNLAEAGESPRWYHFDPTQLDTGGFDHDGCLFTDAELDAYNAYNVGFYNYDRAAYPQTATESLR